MKQRDKFNKVYLFCREAVHLYALVWHRFSYSGTEHLPESGPYIVAGNHVSFLDPPLIGVGIRDRQVYMLAKDSLFSTRFSNWLYTQFGAIPIDQSRGDIGALKKSLGVLKRGDVLGLFPEGTRSWSGEAGEAKGGIGFLIRRSKVPVVPAYVAGSYEAMPRGSSWIRPSKIKVCYGKPISPDEVAELGSGRDSYEKVANEVLERILALKNDA